jgi:hypothetical protein
LRAIARKQWKHGRARFAELRRRGVGRDLAAQTAGSPHGPGIADPIFLILRKFVEFEALSFLVFYNL